MKHSVEHGADEIELRYYQAVADEGDQLETLAAELLRLASSTKPHSFNRPREHWLDARYESTAQDACYEHVSEPIRQAGRMLQLGGSGLHAVKALLGGASAATLLTPVPGEGEMGRQLAERVGVESRFTVAEGIGETMPFEDASFEAVVSGSCLHHTEVADALPEIRRILSPGGRFAAWDPWRSPLYQMGITVFGKRERGVNCKPLESNRLTNLKEVFPLSEIHLYGSVYRYPSLVAEKFGYHPPIERLHDWAELDEKICVKVPKLRKLASCVAVLATKPE